MKATPVRPPADDPRVLSGPSGGTEARGTWTHAGPRQIETRILGGQPPRGWKRPSIG